MMSGPLFTTCATCGVTVIGRTAWYKRTPEVRAQLKAQGIHARRADRCITCFSREERRDASAPAPYSNPRMDRDLLLAEWAHFADPSLSRAENCRRLAPRLNMRWRTLERHLDRAGVTGNRYAA